MRERFRQFMMGRYGTDELNNFITILTFISLILSFISRYFSIITTVLLVCLYYRMFSRNFTARRAENAKFLKAKYKLTHHFSKEAGEERRNFHIYKCPSCGQKIRIPRGKGKIMITCPKCGGQFVKRS